MMNDIQMTDVSYYSSNTSFNMNYQEKKEIPKIRVIVRKRPLNKKESFKNEIDIVNISNQKTVVVKEMKTKIDLTKYIEEHNFNFDNVFDDTTSNEQVKLIYNF